MCTTSPGNGDTCLIRSLLHTCPVCVLEIVLFRVWGAQGFLFPTSTFSLFQQTIEHSISPLCKVGVISLSNRGGGTLGFPLPSLSFTLKIDKLCHNIPFPPQWHQPSPLPSPPPTWLSQQLWFCMKSLSVSILTFLSLLLWMTFVEPVVFLTLTDVWNLSMYSDTFSTHCTKFQKIAVCSNVHTHTHTRTHTHTHTYAHTCMHTHTHAHTHAHTHTRTHTRMHTHTRTHTHAHTHMCTHTHTHTHTHQLLETRKCMKIS